MLMNIIVMKTNIYMIIEIIDISIMTIIKTMQEFLVQVQRLRVTMSTLGRLHENGYGQDIGTLLRQSVKF